MSNPETSDIYFSDERLATAFGTKLGNLAGKFALLCDDDARNKCGETYFLHPSNVELTPYITIADQLQPEIVVRAWHETGIPGKSAVFQKHDTAAEMIVDGEDAFLVNKDTKTNYPLTTREAFLLHAICNAALNYAIADRRNE